MIPWSEIEKWYAALFTNRKGTADTTTARKILKINRDGLLISTTGYSGTFTSILDMTGKLDAAVLKGVISAALIKTGTLTDTPGNVSWNLANGTFSARSMTVTSLTATTVSAGNG